jgi:hypothetical protein
MSALFVAAPERYAGPARKSSPLGVNGIISATKSPLTCVTGAAKRSGAARNSPLRGTTKEVLACRDIHQSFSRREGGRCPPSLLASYPTPSVGSGGCASVAWKPPHGSGFSRPKESV